MTNSTVFDVTTCACRIDVRSPYHGAICPRRFVVLLFPIAHLGFSFGHLDYDFVCLDCDVYGAVYIHPETHLSSLFFSLGSLFVCSKSFLEVA